MFWRKRKTLYDEVSSIQELATRLGVERRKDVRIKYPPIGAICKLPEISFDGNMLEILNISIGGCLLLDPNEYLGPSIGQDVELYVHWPTATETMQARIVTRVDHRRHIQFLNIPDYRQQQIAKSLTPGLRGLGVHNHAVGSELSPTIEAAELWSSLLGDSVILEHDVHRLAQIHYENTQYTVYLQSWPVKNNGKQCTRVEYEQILLFLANIPAPSWGIKALIDVLGKMLKEKPE
jgi:hypothetical protein